MMPITVQGPASDPHVAQHGGSTQRLRFFSDFTPGTRVLDVGCGQGVHLRELAAQGCDVIGLDCDDAAAESLRREGHSVVQGRAEELPFDEASFDAIVCSVVVPYTDERRAIAEWSRVLAPGGQVRASYHGAAWFLNYLLHGPTWRLRLYGARTLLNGCVYRLTGRRLPGFWGDTLYQSVTRLRQYYACQGLGLVQEYVRPGIGGLRDTFFHHLEKAE
jgi:SAM-dependent methyltransferase